MDTLAALDQPAPGFTLPDLNGIVHQLSDFIGKIVVVNFWSAECPWSERMDREMLAQQNLWGDQVVLLNIAANTNEPLELLRKVAGERGLPFVLCDAGQIVVRLYGGMTTPHCFVIDSAGVLRYRGAFDDKTFRQRRPTRSYVRDAVEALLARHSPDPAETPAYGCTIVKM